MLVVHSYLRLPKGQRVTFILMIYHDISIRVLSINTASSYFPLRYHLRIIWTINTYGWWSEPSMLHFPSEENWQGNHVPGNDEGSVMVYSFLFVEMTGHSHMFPAKDCRGPGTCSSGAMPRWSSHRADVWSAPQAIPIWTNHHFLFFLLLKTPQAPG